MATINDPNPNPPEVTYRGATEEDIPQLLTTYVLMANADPVHNFVKPPERRGNSEEIIKDQEKEFRHFMDEGYFMVAEVGGQIVGYAIWDIFHEEKLREAYTDPDDQAHHKVYSALTLPHISTYGPDWLELMALGTHPDHRNEGYATALLQDGLSVAAKL